MDEESTLFTEWSINAALGKATKYIDLLVRVQNETQKM